MNSQPEVPGTGAPRGPERTVSKPIVLAALAISLVIYAALRPATIRAAWEEFERVVLLKSEPLPASPPRMSEHLIEELASLSPQKQAEMLVRLSVNHYAGAMELLGERVDGWRGQLQLTPEFNGLLMAAINSNDLRVRAATLEVYLAAYNVEKTETAANQLICRIQDEPGARPWALWMLGALGNRGVQPVRVLSTLLDYVKDPSEETRVWAVEGLALLGSENTIRPLPARYIPQRPFHARARARRVQPGAVRHADQGPAHDCGAGDDPDGCRPVGRHDDADLGVPGATGHHRCVRGERSGGVAEMVGRKRAAVSSSKAWRETPENRLREAASFPFLPQW